MGDIWVDCQEHSAWSANPESDHLGRHPGRHYHVEELLRETECASVVLQKVHLSTRCMERARNSTVGEGAQGSEGA